MSKKELPPDPNQAAKRLLDIITGEKNKPTDEKKNDRTKRLPSKKEP